MHITRAHHQRIIAMHYTFVNKRKEFLERLIREVVRNASKPDFATKFTPGMFSVYCQPINPDREIKYFRLLFIENDPQHGRRIDHIFEGNVRFLIRCINENRDMLLGDRMEIRIEVMYAD